MNLNIKVSSFLQYLLYFDANLRATGNATMMRIPLGESGNELSNLAGIRCAILMIHCYRFIDIEIRCGQCIPDFPYLRNFLISVNRF